jgi:hypothetical protein
VIFGAEDRFLNLFADLQRLAPMLPLAGATARFQPVWVEDVAEAVVRGLAGPVPPVIECAGPQVLTLSDLARLAGRWSGHERPQIALPLSVGTLQAALMERLPGPTLMSRDNVESMRVPNVASGTLPGLAALGITAAALEAVMPAVLAGAVDARTWTGCARAIDRPGRADALAGGAMRHVHVLDAPSSSLRRCSP